jgi:hypothetical protein
MATLLLSGLRATAVISGTAAYTNLADVDNWISFSSMTNNDQTYVTAIAQDGTFEVFRATKTGGLTPTLARTAIVVQTDRSTNPVNWTPNTPVTLYTTAPGELLALITGANTWSNDQTISGVFKQKFGDGSQYIYSPTAGKLDIVNGPVVAEVNNNANSFAVFYTDDSATVGPRLVTRRLSTTPASLDVLGAITFEGRNASGGDVEFGSVQGVISTNVAGNENGEVWVTGIASGVKRTIAEFNYSNTAVHPSNINGSFQICKNTSNGAVDGFEFTAGILYLTNTSLAAQLVLNRKGSDGKMLVFQRDGLERGYAVYAGGTMSLTGFVTTGATLLHPSEWHDGRSDPDDMKGMVVCTADGILDDGWEGHPLCRVSDRPGAADVYGAVWGRGSWPMADGTEIQALMICGAGTPGLVRVIGPVKRGDLLETSEVEGCARAQVDNIQRSSTLAKAVQASADNGSWRLVPCTMLAG